ncbi:hypothetical protein EDC01DRAFT_751258 [Geopyxis carbonaria]|nr:hypothetical protein EDC01DRAFT_751258 [Geopyxis carbonaria]
MAATVTSYLAAYTTLSFPALSSHLSPTFTFTDPAFGPLTPPQSRGMFRMFLANAPKSNLRVTVTRPPTSVAGKENVYSLAYACDYTFAPGRVVRNEIESEVTLDENGRVCRQVDGFDLGGWAWQAGGGRCGGWFW